MRPQCTCTEGDFNKQQNVFTANTCTFGCTDTCMLLYDKKVRCVLFKNPFADDSCVYNNHMGNRLAASKFWETFTVTPTEGPWGSTCPTCEGVCKGHGYIPLNVVDASCKQLCRPLLFEEFSTFRNCAKQSQILRRYNNSAAKKTLDIWLQYSYQ